MYILKALPTPPSKDQPNSRNGSLKDQCQQAYPTLVFWQDQSSASWLGGVGNSVKKCDVIVIIWGDCWHQSYIAVLSEPIATSVGSENGPCQDLNLRHPKCL